MACISCTVRRFYQTRFGLSGGMASTRWICSAPSGSRYCMKCMNDLIAARLRVFLELMPFPARHLQVAQEIDDQRGINLFEDQLRGLRLQPRCCELKEQLESVGVGLTGIAAGISFVDQPLPQEGRDVRRYWGHGDSPTNRSLHCYALHEVRSRLEVPVGGVHIDVSQVRRQCHHVPSYLIPFARAGLQGPYCERVAQRMRRGSR